MVERFLIMDPTNGVFEREPSSLARPKYDILQADGTGTYEWEESMGIIYPANVVAAAQFLVEKGKTVRIEGDLTVHMGAVDGTGVLVREGGKLVVTGNLLVDRAGVAATTPLVWIDGGSTLEVTGTTNLTHAGGGAVGCVLVEGASKAKLQGTLTVATDGTGNVVQANRESTILIVGATTVTITGNALTGVLVASADSDLHAVGTVDINMADTSTGPVIVADDLGTAIFDAAVTMTPTGVATNWDNAESKIVISDGANVKFEAAILAASGGLAVDYGATGFIYLTAGSKVEFVTYDYEGPIVAAGASEVLATTGIVIGDAGVPVAVNRTCLSLTNGSKLTTGTLAVQRNVVATADLVSVSGISTLEVGITTTLVHSGGGAHNTLSIADGSQFVGIGTVTITTNASDANKYIIYCYGCSSIAIGLTTALADLTIVATGVVVGVSYVLSTSRMSIHGNLSATFDSSTSGTKYQVGTGSDVYISGAFALAGAAILTGTLISISYGSRMTAFGTTTINTPACTKTNAISVSTNSTLTLFGAVDITINSKQIIIAQMSGIIRLSGVLTILAMNNTGVSPTNDGTIIQVVTGSKVYIKGLVHAALDCGHCAQVLVDNGSQFHVTGAVGDSVALNSHAGAAAADCLGIWIQDGSQVFAPAWAAPGIEHSGIGALAASGGDDYKMGTVAAANWNGSERIIDAATQLTYLSKP